jgi:predicted nucleic acid-binding protein
VIVVDTSVWVDYFNGRITDETDALHLFLGEQQILLGDLILTEVLQGFRSDHDFEKAQALLRPFPVVSMVGHDMAIRSAENYRRLCRLGVTVRKTIDVIIGTYCIEQRFALLYSDRDFDPMVKHLGLMALAVSP